MNKDISIINLGTFNFFLVCFLLFSFNVFSQSIALEMLIDKYDIEKYSYNFINSKVKIVLFTAYSEAPNGAVYIEEYSPSNNNFSMVKAFKITEFYNNYNKDGYNWLYLKDDWHDEYTLTYNPKTKKAEFSKKYYPQNPQKFTFITDSTLIKNKISSLQKKFLDDKLKNDKVIETKLDEIIKKRDIKSLPNYRKTIVNDVYFDENKTRYLNKLEKEIEVYNDSLLVLFSTALENKNKELISSSMNDLIEYEYKEELNNRIFEKFDLNRTLSITNTERFKDYFVNFSVNEFPFFTVYNESATINFEIVDGKVKSSTGHTLNYSFSDDEKIILEPFIFFKVKPRLESFTIKKNVKLVASNKTYIHGKKDSKTLFLDKQTLVQEEKTTFRGGKWKPKLIFSKKRFPNSEPIKTTSIESLRNKIKSNINETFGFKVNGQPGKFKVTLIEDMNTYFNISISQNTQEGYFSKDKKVVNVYTEWVYELYINDKKINDPVKTKFKSSSPFSSINKPIYFNKPFYTIDVFEVF